MLLYVVPIFEVKENRGKKGALGKISNLTGLSSRDTTMEPGITNGISMQAKSVGRA